MLSKTPVFLTALVLALASPAVANDHHDHDGPEPHIIVLAEFDLGEETYYLVNDHGALQYWQESNGLLFGGQPRAVTGADSGLQVESVCLEADEVHYDEVCDEDAIEVEADTRLTRAEFVDAILGSLA